MPSGAFTPTPASRPRALADARKMLPVWQASGALFPSIYLSDAATPDPVRQFRVNATVEIAKSAAEMVAAADPNAKRLPVYPFAWECYHNGTTLLTHEDAVIDLISPCKRLA